MFTQRRSSDSFTKKREFVADLRRRVVCSEWEVELAYERDRSLTRLPMPTDFPDQVQWERVNAELQAASISPVRAGRSSDR